MGVLIIDIDNYVYYINYEKKEKKIYIFISTTSLLQSNLISSDLVI